MRHTLIPTEERNKLLREYHVRAIIVLCLALSVAGVLGVSSLLPSFLRSEAEEQTRLDEIAFLEKQKDATGIAAVENELAADNLLLTALSTADEIHLSDKIQEIIRLRGGVKIHAMLLARVGTSTITAVVQGLAPTREILLAYKSHLENDTPGTIVELPLSQLAKSKDIPFSLQIIQKIP
jgi:hypothetical protein